MDQFILEYKNAFTREYCNSVIEYYENAVSAGFGYTRKQVSDTPAQYIDDTAVFAHSEYTIKLDHSWDLVRHFSSIFWRDCYSKYISQVPSVSNMTEQGIFTYKIQKTLPGQGYHVWHHEVDGKSTCQRTMAWMLYLNDVEEGGETEFLYQRCRIRPTAGTVVMWPGYYTHIHRGNPPLSGPKYIVTGNLEF